MEMYDLMSSLGGTFIPGTTALEPIVRWTQSKCDAIDQRISKLSDGTATGPLAVSDYYFDQEEFQNALSDALFTRLWTIQDARDEISRLGRANLVWYKLAHDFDRAERSDYDQPWTVEDWTKFISTKSTQSSWKSNWDTTYRLYLTLAHPDVDFPQDFIGRGNDEDLVFAFNNIFCDSSMTKADQAALKVWKSATQNYCWRTISGITQDVSDTRDAWKMDLIFYKTITKGNVEDVGELASLFMANVQSRFGNISSNLSSYATLAMDLLSDSGSSLFDKVRSWAQVKVNDGDSTGGFSQIEDCTGIEPASAMEWDIDLSWTKALLILVSPYHMGKALFLGAKWLGQTIWNWAAPKVQNTVEKLTDPLDIKTNDKFGDYSFQNGYQEFTWDWDTVSDKWPDMLSKLDEHDGQYCMLTLLGATWYVKYDSTDDLIHVILKKHLYSGEVAAKLVSWLSLERSADEAISDYAYMPTFLANNFTDVNCKLDNYEKEHYNECYCMKSLLQSQRLITAGLLSCIAVDQDRAINILRYYGDVDQSKNINCWSALYNNYAFRIAVLDPTQWDNLTITNQSWADEITGDTATTDNLNRMRTLIENYLFKGLSIAFVSETTFFPYVWTKGQLYGRYSIKTDTENAAVAKKLVILGTAVLIGIVVSTVTLIAKTKLKHAATSATRLADGMDFQYNTDSEGRITSFVYTGKEMRQQRLKANVLSTLSGWSFVDVAKGAVSNITGALSSKISGDTDEINASTTKTNTDLSSVKTTVNTTGSEIVTLEKKINNIKDTIVG